jgi:hypothetical protein
MLSVEYQNIVQYACVQMATKVNQVRYANSMSASEMMTVNRISTVVKIKCAGILVWRLEHVVAKHSAELSTDMLSVHAHQAIMATHCSNVNKVETSVYETHVEIMQNVVTLKVVLSAHVSLDARVTPIEVVCVRDLKQTCVETNTVE